MDGQDVAAEHFWNVSTYGWGDSTTLRLVCAMVQTYCVGFSYNFETRTLVVKLLRT
ncbi:MAG: hypothetical protein QM811_05960 [Pirellulales bacterium]